MGLKWGNKEIVVADFEFQAGSGERQKPMTQKRMSLLKNGDMDEETRLRYNRNKKMIDLGEIPDEYKTQILSEYNKEEPVGRELLFNFFIKKKLKHLITDIQDF